MSRLRYSLLFIIFFASLLIQAQEATEEPDTSWEIIERCVGDPITPPDDWTFEGTILATGWAGVHGFNADWDTPRILHFTTKPTYESHILEGAIVTPNNEYIELFRGGSADIFYYASELVISSLYDRSISRRFILPVHILEGEGITWSDSTEHYNGSINLFWWDGDHVGVLDYLINIHTGEITDLPVGFLFSTPVTTSPDWTREVGIQNIGNSSWQGLRVLDDKDAERVHFDGVFQLDAVDWFLDSSQFIAIGRAERITNNRFIYVIDRNGNLLSTIFEIETEWGFSASLSPSNRYYAFHFVETGLMIVDFENEIIYDMCFDRFVGIWSTDSQQIVLSCVYQNCNPLLVLDLNDWKIYQTDFYHEGYPTMWVNWEEN